jgi:hypothetical protein
VNPVGVGAGAGGYFVKGLLGGNSDFGSVLGFMEAKGFAFCSVDDDRENVLDDELGAVIFANGLVPEEAPDSKENDGSCVENEGAFIDPNSPPELDAGG